MLVVGGQSPGERSRCDVGLLGFLRVDNRDEKVGKLRELFLEHLGALPPRQARREHFIGVGRDAEVTGRIPTGEDRQNEAGKDDKQSVAPAKIDQAGKQGLERYSRTEAVSHAAVDGRPSRLAQVNRADAGGAARLGWRQVIICSRGRRYCKMLPASRAVICRRRTRSGHGRHR